jgi:hypothetical protein
MPNLQNVHIRRASYGQAVPTLQTNSVTASEARQSIVPNQNKVIDCRASLAMTTQGVLNSYSIYD